MGLSAGVAIVTAADVAAITHETGLANVDGADGSTLANLLGPATDFLIRECRYRGVIPEEVSNTSELKEPAALWVAWKVYVSRPLTKAENKEKADLLRELLEDVLKRTVFKGTREVTNADKGLPRGINVTHEPVFRRPADNSRPRDPLGPYWLR